MVLSFNSGPDIWIAPFRQRDGVSLGVEGGTGAVHAARLKRHPDCRGLATSVIGRPRRRGWPGLRLSYNAMGIYSPEALNLNPPQDEEKFM